MAWKESNHNPVVMLGRVSQASLERAAADPRFLALYRRACDILDAYLAPKPDIEMLVAYFSMEYGLLDCMPIYSGGLGCAFRRSFESVERRDGTAGRASVSRIRTATFSNRSIRMDGSRNARRSTISIRCPLTPVDEPRRQRMLMSACRSATPKFS